MVELKIITFIDSTVLWTGLFCYASGLLKLMGLLWKLKDVTYKKYCSISYPVIQEILSCQEDVALMWNGKFRRIFWCTEFFQIFPSKVACLHDNLNHSRSQNLIINYFYELSLIKKCEYKKSLINRDINGYELDIEVLFLMCKMSKFYNKNFSFLLLEWR